MAREFRYDTGDVVRRGRDGINAIVLRLCENHAKICYEDEETAMHVHQVVTCPLALGLSLADMTAFDHFSTWRHRHVQIVRRISHNRPVAQVESRTVVYIRHMHEREIHE